jgi:hypothetical protein
VATPPDRLPAGEEPTGLRSSPDPGLTSVSRFVWIPLLLLARLPGQVVALELVDPKAQARLARHVQEIDGRRCVVGHALAGVQADRSGNFEVPKGSREVQMAVVDPMRPELPVIQAARGGGFEAASRDRLVRVAIGETDPRQGVRVLLRDETVEGLRQQYLGKRNEISELRKRLSRLAPASAEAFQVRRRLMAELSALAAWCRASAFPGAARSIEQEAIAERQALRTAGEQDRLGLAESRIGAEPPPAELIEAAGRLGRPGQAWRAASSLHFRIVAVAEIPASALLEALRVGERTLEAFRSRVIDPYLPPEERDPVPDGIFAEWAFVPEDPEFAAGLFEGYYGGRIPAPREKALRLLGQRGRDLRGVPTVSQWRKVADLDIEGTVVHILGHALVDLLYRKDPALREPAWLAEGLSYWLSFEQLSRNTVTCVAFDIGEYARAARAEGEKGALRTHREMFEAQALQSGPPVDRLFRLRTFELTGPDLAKSWSLVDWLLRHRPDRAHRFFLRAAAAGTPDGPMRLDVFRADLAGFLDADPASNLYGDLDKAWREDLVQRRRAAEK